MIRVQGCAVSILLKVIDAELQGLCAHVHVCVYPCIMQFHVTPSVPLSHPLNIPSPPTLLLLLPLPLILSSAKVLQWTVQCHLFFTSLTFPLISLDQECTTFLEPFLFEDPFNPPH